MNENQEEKNTTFSAEDQQMQRVLHILNDIPQQTLPEAVESRLKEALQEEGKKIRALREAAEMKTKKKKRIFRGLTTLAACLMVGVVSISMYNSMGSDPDPNDETPSAGSYVAEEENKEKAVAFSKAEEEPVVEGSELADLSMVPQHSAAYGTYGGVLQAKCFEGGATDDESRSGTTREAVGTGESSEEALAGDGDMALAAMAPEDPNLPLLKEYLKIEEFTVLSTKTDENTGRTEYEIHLFAEEEGKIVEKTLSLYIEEGVVYEKQPGE